jgi:hypothetical protein
VAIVAGLGALLVVINTAVNNETPWNIKISSHEA